MPLLRSAIAPIIRRDSLSVSLDRHRLNQFSPGIMVRHPPSSFSSTLMPRSVAAQTLPSATTMSRTFRLCNPLLRSYARASSEFPREVQMPPSVPAQIRSPAFARQRMRLLGRPSAMVSVCHDLPAFWEKQRPPRVPIQSVLRPYAPVRPLQRMSDRAEKVRQLLPMRRTRPPSVASQRRWFTDTTR